MHLACYCHTLELTVNAHIKPCYPPDTSAELEGYLAVLSFHMRTCAPPGVVQLLGTFVLLL